MNQDIEKILLNTEQIQHICHKLGTQISENYSKKTPLVIGLLKGCVPFIGDLIKHITIPIEIEYMEVSSYHGGTKSSLSLDIKKDLTQSIKNKDIILVEDIVDTGTTLRHIISLLYERGARNVEVVTLLNKQEGRIEDVTAKYIGQEIPKEFVVGYGMDYKERYRNLPYVGILKESVYQ